MSARAEGPNLPLALEAAERAKWAPDLASISRRLHDGTYEEVGDWPEGGCGSWTIQEWVAWGRRRADLARHLLLDALELETYK